MDDSLLEITEPATEHQPFSCHERSNPSDFLTMDPQTQKELLLFSDHPDEPSLFQLCNHTKNQGGAIALQQRMQKPWAQAEQIRATQQSIHHINEHPETFNTLPSHYLTNRVQEYLAEPLPIVTQTNKIEFTLSALFLQTENRLHFNSIKRGVLLTCKLIGTVRQFVHRPEVITAAGEIKHFIEELTALIERPALASISEHDASEKKLKVLRLDQTFRLKEKETIHRLLTLIYEMDALIALAKTTQQHHMVLPSIDEQQIRVHAKGLTHLFINNATANDVELNPEKRLTFLTGPNMAGKTTYLRAIATALYLAHLGMGVPAVSFQFSPVDCLFCTFSINDDQHSGISFFRAEALRIKTLCQTIAEGRKLVAFIDEPFKGTNVKDAFDASLAILNKLSEKERGLFMVSSHLIELSEYLGSRVDYRYFEAKEDGEQLHFDYKVHTGVSDQRLGMRVLREEGIFDLLR